VVYPFDTIPTITCETEHEEGIVSMAASENSNQLLTMGGDELLCIWQWNGNSATSSRTGSQPPRSVLEFSSLIR